MKTVKIIIIISVFLLVLTSLIYSTYPLSAINKNGRMVLRGYVGEIINRTIGVANNNSYPIKIELIPSGELKDIITVIDNNFTLSPGEEKNARIKIKVNKEGMQNGTVIVKYLPADIKDGKNGVILSSTIIVIGYKSEDKNTKSSDNDDTTNTNSLSKFFSNFKFNPVVIGLIITFFIALVFLVLLFIYFNKKNYSTKEVIEKRVDEIKSKKRVKSK
ncbi:MAG: hypothetical protein QXW97_03370 [Candidatus Pacearchaeota archaeon]